VGGVQLENANHPVHIAKMSEDRKIPVFFICHGCGSLYVAWQQHKHEAGQFDCRGCAKNIHRWSGNYTFTNWVEAF
jgi:hypothetical protein